MTALPLKILSLRILLSLCLLTISRSSAQTPSEQLESALRTITESANDQSASLRLHQLFDAEWAYRMAEFPEEATWRGIEEGADRWTDLSFESIERRRIDVERLWDAIQSIERSNLETEDQLNHDLFEDQIRLSREASAFPNELLALDQMWGIQTSAPAMLTMMPARTLSDFEDQLGRLARLPRLIDQTIDLLREGVRTGITQPSLPLRDVVSQIEDQILEDPASSPLLAAFQNLPESLSASEKERLKTRAATAYTEGVRPAFTRLRDFMRDTYLTNGRPLPGLNSLDNGENWYRFKAAEYTTTDLTPRQIHEIGLAEVERIRGEMIQVKESAGFDGDLSDFFTFLREDDQFYFDSGEALLATYRDICKRADPELAALFGVLPRQPYGVKKIPEYAERSATTAYYQPGSTKAGRPGYFFANTFDLRSRPKWEMEALSLHEAVPGHHLQLAIADELEGIPEFRKAARYTAYVEGWGLYAESLGEAMGFYRDPYAKMGALTYEIWRSIRLVVDTGIHAFGWSREDAIQFFMENAGKTRHDIEVEVDRYIVWPGQALAYKIGELEIQKIRREAEAALGDRFDIRAFHDELLGAGALPLNILRIRMEQWVKSVAKSL